jgi:hypothetical protein
MNGREFFDRVATHDGLEYIGVREAQTPADDVVIIRTKRQGMYTLIHLNAILEHPWDALLALLLGQRDAKVMGHISRIVGYYSNIRNWNMSKVAELADRHHGNYTLPESFGAQASAPSTATAAA